jgi:fructose-specific PTS system IIA-like component
MSLQHRFECPLPEGMHARPASALEELARTFTSEVVLVNQRTGRAADSKSVLAIIAADIRFQDPCVVTASGADEREAIAKISAFVADTLPHCDDTPPQAARTNGEWRLPPGLRQAGVTFHRGVAVVPGIGQGRVVHAGGFRIPAELSTGGVSDRAAERGRLDAALARLLEAYDQRLASEGKGIEGELLKAHRSIARDQEFQRRLHEAIEQRGCTAAGAIAEAETHFHKLFAGSTNARLRERTLDVQDVCLRLLRQAYGNAAGAAHLQLTSDTIVVAELLTPGQFLALDRRFLKGVVLGQAGTTSHTVILARSFGIPTLTAVKDLDNGRLEGQEAVVDGDLGALVSALTERVRRYYALELRRITDRQARLRRFAGQPAATQDGHRLEIAANVVSAEEAESVFAAGAEGIGLFRTEMLFLDRESAPNEAEQFEEYRRVAEAAAGRAVAVRTLDIGGDKPLAYLNLPAEQNPFLGCRAVRLYPAFEALIRAQIRALVRASSHGRLKMMLPMVATVEEARWVKKVLREEQGRCAADGLPYDAAMPVGAMLEVPAAAFSLDALCAELDFFSIGSNDLLQYFMAVDRTNASVAALYNPLQPAFLRLLKQIVDGVHARGKQVSMCGEMAGVARYLPLLAGLGLDAISVAGPAVAALKAELAGLALPDCRRLLAEALVCATADEVSGLLERFGAQRIAPLLEPELVMTNVEAATKEEAIKQMIDRLYVLGRTGEPLTVEQSVWQREATYSTGFGFGFAIPHCKTDAVRANSLVLLKLRAPVAWGSLDGQPVRVVLLLAIRETDGAAEHMKVLARLARKLMHEEFRARLEREDDPAALCAFLHETIKS